MVTVTDDKLARRNLTIDEYGDDDLYGDEDVPVDF